MFGRQVLKVAQSIACQALRPSSGIKVDGLMRLLMNHTGRCRTCWSAANSIPRSESASIDMRKLRASYLTFGLRE